MRFTDLRFWTRGSKGKDGQIVEDKYTDSNRQTRRSVSRSRRGEAGNVLTLAIGAVALTAAASAVAVKGLVGPVKTAQRVAQQNIVQSQQLASVKIISALSVTSDCDTDYTIEPNEFRPKGADPAPSGGGLLPNGVGLTLSDPWGTQYGYCVWDLGLLNNGTGSCSATNYLQGDGTENAEAKVMAVVSAGPNRIFETTCANFTGDPNAQVTRAAGSDDVVYDVTYAEAGAGSGLWSLSGTDVAKIGILDQTGDAAGIVKAEDISTTYTDLTGKTGIGEFMALKADNIISKAGKDDPIELKDPLQFDTSDVTGSLTCNAANLGTISSSTSGASICFYDGAAYAWRDIGGDNLGDHTATQALDMGGNNISNAGSITGSSLDAGSGAIQTSGTLSSGAATVSSLDAGSGAIQTSGTLSSGAATVSSLDAGSGAIQTSGTLSSGAATVSSLDAGSGAIQTSGTLNAGAATVSSLDAGGGGIANAGAIAGATTITASGTVSAGSVSSTGAVTAGSVSSSGGLSVTGTSTLSGAVTTGSTLATGGDITAGGNIDLGTNKLVGNAGTTGISIDASGNLTVDGTGSNYIAGNLGIGDSSPGSRLEVNGTVRANTICDRTGTTCINMSDLSGSGGSGALGYWQAGTGANEIYYSAGDIGIGTDSPAYPLHVVGTVKADAFIGESDPQVGALTDTKWCHVSGTTIVCDQDPPSMTDADTLGDLSCTDGQVASWDASGSAWICADQTGGSGSGGKITHLTQTSATMIPDSTWTTIAFDTETRDDGGWHDNATNNSRITVGATGLYRIEGFVSRATTANSEVSIRLLVNGTADYEYTASQSSGANTGGVNQSEALNVVRQLTAGDYLEIQLYAAGSGGSNTVPAETFFMVSDAVAGGGAGSSLVVIDNTYSASIPIDQVVSGTCNAAGTQSLVIPTTGTYAVRGRMFGYKYSGNIVIAAIRLYDSGNTLVFQALTGTARTRSHYFSVDGTDIVNLAAGTYTVMAYVSDGGSCGTTAVDKIFTGSIFAHSLSTDGGSDTLSGLSCTDGQVASWDASGSAWVCADVSTLGIWADGATSGEVYYSGGNVGIGTNNPAADLHVYNTNGGGLLLEGGGTNQASINFLTTGDGTKNLGNAATKGWHLVARGDSYANADEAGDLITFHWDGTSWRGSLYHDGPTGYIGVRTATPTVALDVVGDIQYTDTLTDASDMRLKDNIAPLDKETMLRRLLQVEGVSFTMKDDENQQVELGVIAQQIETLFPELVMTADDDMGTKSVNYIGLVAPTIEAIKAQYEEIEQQQARIDMLQQQNEDMMLRLAALEEHTGIGPRAAMMPWQAVMVAALLMIIAAMAGATGVRIARRRS